MRKMFKRVRCQRRAVVRYVEKREQGVRDVIRSITVALCARRKTGKSTVLSVKPNKSSSRLGGGTEKGEGTEEH